MAFADIQPKPHDTAEEVFHERPHDCCAFHANHLATNYIDPRAFVFHVKISKLGAWHRLAQRCSDTLGLYATPFSKKRPFTKQVWHDGHPVKPGDIVSRLTLFEIGLHGSEMILARDFEGFGLFGADVFFGAFNAGVAKQELGRAKIAGLLIDVGWKGPA